MKFRRQEFIEYMRGRMASYKDKVALSFSERHLAAVERMTDEEFQAHETDLYRAANTGPLSERTMRLRDLVNEVSARYCPEKLS